MKPDVESCFTLNLTSEFSNVADNGGNIERGLVKFIAQTLRRLIESGTEGLPITAQKSITATLRNPDLRIVAQD